MTGSSKDNAGCWTCRLRSKKYDQAQSICGICLALEITCYSNRQEPPWMDNGEKQRQMAQRLKVDVKRSSARRRLRRLMQRLAWDFDKEGSTQAPESEHGPDACVSPAQGTGHVSNEEREQRSVTPSNDTAGSEATRGTSQFSAGFAPIPMDNPTRPDSHGVSQPVDNELELQSVMIYLDYTFPILFPLYTPSLIEGGRGWLLALLKIRALCYVIISLTSYFFSNVPISSGPAHGICGLFESIVQLFIFDGVVAAADTWRMHLDAATVLFEQIMQPSGSYSSLLNLMGQFSSLPANAYNNIFWTADQAAFRFYSAVLLVADILASTALEHPPKRKNFIGCQNWVLCLMGKIAALDAWKKDLKKRRALNMTQFMERASSIERDIPETTTTTVTLIWAHAARIYLQTVLSGWQFSSPEIWSEVSTTLSLLLNLSRSSPGILVALAWPFCIAGCLAAPDQEDSFHDVVDLMGPLGSLGSMQAALRIMVCVWGRRKSVDSNWDAGSCLRSRGVAVLFV
ncbi:transcription factor domain-containing protein [Aspergillus undulatus]|uniref:transcription factor domain-containing protein n=1 Tax=Aspergillus undulatus TaxID=1810928 RepID=UPI003CCDB2AA